MPRYETVYDIDSKTYAALYHTAWHLLDTAEKTPTGSLLNLQAATVFLAFTFEAYLNHVGFEEIKNWDEIERISYTEKLSILSKHLELKINKSRPPFPTVKELFELRKALAHGRTVRRKFTVSSQKLPDHDAAWRLLPWEKLSTKDVRKYYEDIRAAVALINDSRPKPDPFLWNQGGRGFERRLVIERS